MQILETKISSTLAVLSFCLVPGSAAQAATAADCASLAKFVGGNTTITSASLIPAGGALPEYCRVQGRVDTEIGFEVGFPQPGTKNSISRVSQASRESSRPLALVSCAVMWRHLPTLGTRERLAMVAGR